MRRAGRIIYNLAMALSLLLCLASAALWVRSGWICDELDWISAAQDGHSAGTRTLRIERGGVQLMTELEWSNDRVQYSFSPNFVYSHDPATAYPFLADTYAPQSGANLRRYAALDFDWVPEMTWQSRTPVVVSHAVRSFIFPLFFPTGLFALLPIRFLIAHRRRRRVDMRIAQGLCISCGYDLRASAGCCPECGNVTSTTLREG